MSARLKALGISNRDMMAAKQYERLFTNLGWSRNQIDQALVYGSQLRGSPQDMADQFEHFAKAKLGMSSQEAATAVDVSLGLIDLANEGGGLESLPPLPERHFGADDQRRLDEIRNLRRNDPNAYEEQRAQFELDEIELLEARGAAGGTGPSPQASRPGDRHYGDSAEVRQGSLHQDRMQQIREMRRNDPDAYARNAAAFEREEIALIEQDIAARPAEPSSAEVTSTPAASE